MTRLELFQLYIKRIPATTVANRIVQMFNLLEGAAQTTVIGVMKGELVTSFNDANADLSVDKASMESSIDAQITANNALITEVNGVV